MAQKAATPSGLLSTVKGREKGGDKAPKVPFEFLRRGGFSMWRKIGEPQVREHYKPVIRSAIKYMMSRVGPVRGG